MFKVLSLNENSFSLEMSLIILEKTHSVSRHYVNKHDTIPHLRGEFLHYLIHESYSFAAKCYTINQAQKGIHAAMDSVETYFKWAVIKKDENGFSWPPAERIMTEWIKVRPWMKIMLPPKTHPNYQQLMKELANMNEMNEMFLAQFRNQGNIHAIDQTQAQAS